MDSTKLSHKTFYPDWECSHKCYNFKKAESNIDKSENEEGWIIDSVMYGLYPCANYHTGKEVFENGFLQNCKNYRKKADIDYSGSELFD
jgi:hypothetical protein